MRVDIKNWSDIVTNTAHTDLRMDMYLHGGILDARVHGYFVPDGGAYDFYPNLTQHHAAVAEIFFDFERVSVKSDWQPNKPYWLIFTHPEKSLPCIVEFRAIRWAHDDKL